VEEEHGVVRRKSSGRALQIAFVSAVVLAEAVWLGAVAFVLSRVLS
jgi:hypothetical protein